MIFFIKNHFLIFEKLLKSHFYGVAFFRFSLHFACTVGTSVFQLGRSNCVQMFEATVKFWLFCLSTIGQIICNLRTFFSWKQFFRIFCISLHFLLFTIASTGQQFSFAGPCNHTGSFLSDSQGLKIAVCTSFLKHHSVDTSDSHTLI